MMPIYMKYGAIKGGATATGHEGWIELNSFQWGIGRTISGPTGGPSSRGASAPSISDIVVTKPTDIATVALLREALVGGGQDVSIDFCTTDQGTVTVYLSYTLNNTLISGNAISSGGNLPEESISLNFTKIQCRDLLPGAQNPDGSPASITYDLTTARVS
jgi:type VI secretion system secreted protein Hcp